MHRFSVLYDSFYALGEAELLFPLIPHKQTRILEPSLSFELCPLAGWKVRLCAAGGFSAVFLHSSTDNYQLYAGFPVEARLQFTSAEGFFFFEAGARLRTIQNKVDGFIARHKDLMPFAGIGLLFPGDGL
jgi:hypothetical protein